MRRASTAIVSSALLIFLAACAPCHACRSIVSPSGESTLLPSSLIINECYPRGLCSDEYISLFNAGTSACNLRGWVITDCEGNITFAEDWYVASGSAVTLTFNSSSFSRAYGVQPTMGLDRANQSGIIIVGSFRLGDQGDSILLVSPDGRETDCVRYGTSNDPVRMWIGDSVPEPRQGEVLRRVSLGSGPRDTDRSTDWTPFREFRYGYTLFGDFQVNVGPGEATAFTSPDSSLAVVGGCVDQAERLVKLCAYEVSSHELCRKLVDAVQRGVEVSLLVDGAPAGGISEEGSLFLSVLARHGADVRLVSGNVSEDVVQHVWHMHAKYAVFDDSETLALSENYVEPAFPSDQLRGNRGWGVLVSSTALARRMTDLFNSDSREGRPDVRLWRNDARYDCLAVLPESRDACSTSRIQEPMTITSAATVSVHVSPDCSETAPFLCGLLSSAKRILGEQFQTDLQWTQRWSGAAETSPLVSAVAAAMRNGTESRMIFDSTWFNAERNSATRSHLQNESEASGGVGEFRMMDQGGPIQLLHNKGLVVDDRFSVVSSNNWVFASFARNRELAFVIDSPEMASFYSRAFELDWSADVSAPIADAGRDMEVHIGERVSLNGSFSSDDRAISSWTWDLYRDGTVDGREAGIEFYATSPGKHEAVLTVEDPWGNTDWDVVEFTVLPSAAPSEAAPTDSYWLLPVAGALGVLTGAALARFLRHRGRGKVNHRIGD